MPSYNDSPKTHSGHPMLSNLPPSKMIKGKIVTAEEAVRVIRDGDTVATGGFAGTSIPEEIITTLENIYLENQRPKNLTLVYAAGQGDSKDRGVNHFGHEGLVKKVIGGHWGLVPKLQKLAMDNKIQAYNLPQGVISHMYRDIAAKKPRTITSVGLGTFVDPRNGGGKINSSTMEDIVELIEFDGLEYLAYKTFPINVAILRGTTADTDGNITMEREALTLDSISMAMAAKNSDGFVIVQVERIAEKGTLNARQVKIPGILVDCVVLGKPENHWQTLGTPYNPAYSGEIRVPMSSIKPMPLTERKIIARRSAFELKANSVVNLGIGAPEGVADVANEEKIIDLITLTAEPGVIGGVPSGGINFGTASNTDAIIDQSSQFDYYDGGGLDIAFLGLAQADETGNLNVSKFGPKLAGAGGFINISQNARKVVFVGTFTAKGLKIDIENDELKIIEEGQAKKFVKEVEHVTFSGKYAIQKGQPVLYVTERCVFKLTPQGMELIEVAPGIDIEKNILPNMEFTPIINGTPKQMDLRIFRDEIMHLSQDMITLSVDDRLIYSPEEDLFFVNFENYTIDTRDIIDEIEEMVATIISPLGKKVQAIVNYDNFFISPSLVEYYTDMVKRLVDNYYTGVTRYTTSTFLRMKLGDALSKRNLSPHIYESQNEARQALKKE